MLPRSSFPSTLEQQSQSSAPLSFLDNNMEQQQRMRLLVKVAGVDNLVMVFSKSATIRHHSSNRTDGL